jgi:hypothetical protein
MFRADVGREVDIWRLLAARGSRSWLADRVNVSELLINLVNIAMPKLLSGINQKVRGRLLR